MAEGCRSRGEDLLDSLLRAALDCSLWSSYCAASASAASARVMSIGERRALLRLSAPEAPRSEPERSAADLLLLLFGGISGLSGDAIGVDGSEVEEIVESSAIVSMKG